MLRSGLLRRRREDFHWWLKGQRRRFLGEGQEQEALAAYAGLVHQAFHSEPFAPRVCHDLWEGGRFRSSCDLPAFHTPARREREKSSHHYGHDILLKRHAGLELVGTPLPLLLEHGLKVSRESGFESPRPWSKAFLCMGPLRAQWVQERFGQPALAIGPWIAYARSLLAPQRQEALRGQLGPTLLVVLAHSWDAVERRMDFSACLDAVRGIQAAGGYRSVIWLRHWKDPECPALPDDWIVACNGHRSNPWFLDALRTLMELCQGLATNAFGTHLGYGVALDLDLHWIDVAPEQDLSALRPGQADVEAVEWGQRLALSGQLAALLSRQVGSAPAAPAGDTAAALRSLLQPYWGFDRVRDPEEMRSILRGDVPASCDSAPR